MATWKNWVMNKPPLQQAKQQDHIKTALRIPPQLHGQLVAAAEQNGHSLNAEMLARLSASPLDELKRQNEELKMMLREVLTHLRGQ